MDYNMDGLSVSKIITRGHIRNEGTRRGETRDKTMENVEGCDKLEKCIQIHLKHVGWP